jgi:ribosomal protein S18 acetylase RimI-like enzyme
VELVYRKLTEEDAAAYLALRSEAVETQPRAFGKTPEELREIPAAEIAALLSAKEGFVIGCFDGERLVGTARFVREPSQKERHKGYVRSVYVTPTHLRRGVARSMISAIAREMAADNSFEQLLLCVGTHNTGARALYRSLGFISYGIEPRAMKLESEYVDEEHMVLYLR